jgi:hypothetical protein
MAWCIPFKTRMNKAENAKPLQACRPMMTHSPVHLKPQADDMLNLAAALIASISLAAGSPLVSEGAGRTEHIRT